MALTYFCLLVIAELALGAPTIDEQNLQALTENELRHLLGQHGRSCDNCGRKELVAKVRYLSRKGKEFTHAPANTYADDTIVAKRRHIEGNVDIAENAITSTPEEETKELSTVSSTHWLTLVGGLVKEFGDHIGGAVAKSLSGASGAGNKALEALSDSELLKILNEHGRDCTHCEHHELVEKASYVSQARPKRVDYTSNLVSVVGELLMDAGGHLETVLSEPAAMHKIANATLNGAASAPHATFAGVIGLLRRPELAVSTTATIALRTLSKLGLNIDDNLLGGFLRSLADGVADERVLQVRNACGLLLVIFMWVILPKPAFCLIVMGFILGDTIVMEQMNFVAWIISDAYRCRLLVLALAVPFFLRFVCNLARKLQACNIFGNPVNRKKQRSHHLARVPGVPTVEVPGVMVEALLKNVPLEMLEAELARRAGADKREDRRAGTL